MTRSIAVVPVIVVVWLGVSVQVAICLPAGCPSRSHRPARRSRGVSEAEVTASWGNELDQALCFLIIPCKSQ
jgi:hypothetical protein